MFISVPSSDGVPSSVRVPCGEGNESRYRAIERATEFYGVNKSDSIAYACNDVVQLVDVMKDVLAREDLTRKQRQEIAARLDATSFLDVDVEQRTRVESNR